MAPYRLRFKPLFALVANLSFPLIPLLAIEGAVCQKLQSFKPDDFFDITEDPL